MHSSKLIDKRQIIRQVLKSERNRKHGSDSSPGSSDPSSSSEGEAVDNEI